MAAMDRFAWLCTGSDDCGPEFYFFLVIAVAMPYVIGAALLFGLVVLVRRSTSRDPLIARKSRRILIVLGAIVATVLAVYMTTMWLDGRRSRQRVVDRGFDVYALDGQDIDTKYLAIEPKDTAQSADVKLQTPGGLIHVRQTKANETTRIWFNPPQACNYLGLVDYVTIYSGGDNYARRTPQQCSLVYQESDRSLYTIQDPSRILGSVPYVGIIANTVLIFEADIADEQMFRKMSTTDIKSDITNFMKNAEVVGDDRLH